MLFNLFLNDIYFTNSTAELYNYADDNTICASGVNVATVKIVALGNFHQDYDSLLSSANLTTLDIIRQKCIILEVFKSIKGINPPYLNELSNQVLKSLHTTRFSLNGIVVATVKIVNYVKHSIRCYGTTLWNGLSPEIKCTNNLKHFNSILACWRGTACSCALCR